MQPPADGGSVYLLQCTHTHGGPVHSHVQSAHLQVQGRHVQRVGGIQLAGWDTSFTLLGWGGLLFRKCVRRCVFAGTCKV